MGSLAPVQRRTNHRKSFSEDYDSSMASSSKHENILPLHHRSNGNGAKPGSAIRSIGKRKRRTRSKNKPIYCFGREVDVPVAGVATILFFGALLLMIGSNSLLHASTVVGGTEVLDQPRRPIQHHFDRDGNHHAKSHKHKETLEDESRKLYHQPPIVAGGIPDSEAKPNAITVPKSPVKIIHEAETVDNIFDVVVAGAGPSGLTAALFASRAGLNVHVLGSPSTGLLSQTKHLDNFPSFAGEKQNTGPDWVEATLEQTKSWGASFGPPGLFASSLERQRIAHNDETNSGDVFFSLTTSENTEIRAWSVIVATGATPRKLGLSGEDSLWGNSLHSCAICDGHLYQGSDKKPSTVLVVGGGDAALDAALLLARYATKVIVVHRRTEFTRAHNLASLDAVRSTPNIEILTPYVVEEWITEENDPSQLVKAKLSSKETNDKRTIDIDGAFVMIGASPNTKWTETAGIALDEEGLIQTTANLPTQSSMVTASSVPGLFAAGEVTDNTYKQAITAAAAGAQAAIDAERWLREQRGVTGRSISRKRVDDIPAKSGNEQQIKSVTEHDNRQIYDGLHGPNDCELAAEDCIRSIVEAYPVVVFSKPWCPYCKKALESLALAGLSKESDNLLVIDLSKHDDSQEIQATLKAMTGRRTVPNVFVGGKSIGGGDETRSFQQKGELRPMLVEAGALGKENEAEASEQRRQVQEDEPVEESDEEESEEDSDEESVRHSSTETEICDLLSEDCVREIVNKYPAVLFSLSWCPECKQTLQLLELMGVTEDQLHIIDLDDYKEIALDIRANMKALSGRRGVPNLWVGGKNFGGFHQSQTMKASGDLEAKFREVGLLSALS